MTTDPLTTCANAIASQLTANISGLKVYTFEPTEVQLTATPGFTYAHAVTIGGVDVRRIGPDEHELEIGGAGAYAAALGVTERTTYYTSWRVNLYTGLSTSPDSSNFDDARRLLSSVISAIDADPSLGGITTSDGAARVTSTSWGYTPQDQPVQMIINQATLEAWLKV